MLRAQRPHQRVLDEVVRKLDVAGERPRIPSQCRNRTLDPLTESAQRTLPPSSPRGIADCHDPPTVSISCSRILTAEPYHPDKHFARNHIPAAGWCENGGNGGCLWGPLPCVIGRLAVGAARKIMPEASGLLRGKRGLILGVANNRSLAWGIAKACHGQGAELAFTYQGEALKKRVEPLAQEIGGLVIGHCDVTEPDTVDAAFAAIEAKWGTLDFLVHAIAFSDKDQLSGRYVDTTPENFSKTMLVSCYSFTALAQCAEKLMPRGGALLTLTYYGAEKWMPHYNVMGVAKAALGASVRYIAADLGGKNIRVNAISSGPIKTLAAAGIGDFRYILKWNEYNAPLRRSVTIEEVGDTAVYFLCDLSRGVTGEIHHVDAGYHIVGMKHPDAPDIVVGKE